MKSAAVLDRPGVAVESLILVAAENAVNTYATYVGLAELIEVLADYVAGPARKAIEESLGKQGLISAYLDDAAVAYCQGAKARACGYSVSDVAYYSEQAVTLLLDYALDSMWDGAAPRQEAFANASRRTKRDVDAGDFAASVLDVRRALQGCPEAARVLLLSAESGPAAYDPAADRAAVRVLVEFLGGRKPRVLAVA